MLQIGVALEHAPRFRAPNVDDALGAETVGDLVGPVRAQLASRTDDAPGDGCRGARRSSESTKAAASPDDEYYL